jgi:hypothetical protein
MGHTHYFTWHKEPKKHALTICVAEMQKIILQAKGLLAGPDGNRSPIITPSEVAFNGIGGRGCRDVSLSW